MGILIDRAIGAAYRLVWRAGWWVGYRQAIGRINREDQS